ncbi:NADH-quinone oxidoreductase subunit C [Longirhabdus pacifica]|uniref:NADH-quinone oxidoreductase subunit C n=1 Tax=Longirhabdus pacifica TaxID=2305227 RepID=UPI0010087D7A|nr:NADH-quinone oxidoreductase subunit C [Longirhabdus pacifica]
MSDREKEIEKKEEKEIKKETEKKEEKEIKKEVKKDTAEEKKASSSSSEREKDAQEEEEAAPLPNQDKLDKLVALFKGQVSEDAVVDAYINELDHHVPVVTVHSDHLLACAAILLSDEQLKLNYLRNVSGVDYETHLEVVYQFVSMELKHHYVIKVKTDRDQPVVPSLTSLWKTADWNEREIYDLLGITFTGHPNMKRIMMPDDWVGHPLRKDYEAADPEV